MTASSQLSAVGQ